jgi:two-component system sensor histidine kinase KdpD
MINFLYTSSQTNRKALQPDQEYLDKKMSLQNATQDNFEKDRDRLHLQMMSAVSHDLKTPLASIIGSLEIHNKMNAALSPEKKAMLLTTALEEAYRLDGFISNILDMARLENGMTKVHKREYDLEQIIQDCIQKIVNLHERAEIKVIKPSELITCETDASLLSRAINCILDNAIKHSGNEKTKIQIDYTAENNQVTLHIKDDGTGIPPGEEEKIFNKYTRIAKKDHKNAGTGLGLTLARAIIELLGGYIHLQPSDTEGPYQGACFKIGLPCQ